MGRAMHCDPTARRFKPFIGQLSDDKINDPKGVDP
jgi:hypothetical protein